MTCRELSELLLAYLDGELSAEQHARLTEHLNRCPPCAHYLHSYQVTVQVTRVAYAESETPVPDELVKAVMAARRGQGIA